MNPRREPTLADVAKEAGVSLTTVSRVLNDRGYLSQETRDKVAAAIEVLGYRPNQVARALHGKRTQTIGLVVPTVELPFFGELAVNIENALSAHGYRVLICNSMGKADRERDLLNLLVGNRVDGIISGAHNENLEEYSTIRMPLVTVDRELAPNIPNVRCANEDGGRLATRALIDAGCTRPALLTSRSRPRNLRERGYRAVLKEEGIDPIILTADFHTPVEQRQTIVNEALDSVAEIVDGVFATDDLAAAEVLEWARLRGRSVPGDLKVIGFDGTTTVRRALPGLSTIVQPLARIATAAVEILMSQIEAREAGHPLVVGEVAPVEFPITLFRGRTL